MKVVCDSSTLISLSRIGRLDIIENTVESLLIPMAVYEEVVIRGFGRPGAAEVREAKWIEKREISDREVVMRLHVSLDLGESEAIALAKEVKADLIVLDDERARKTALSEGLRVAGLLAFLVQAKEKGAIEEVRPLLDELKHRGFFMSEELYHHTIQEAGE